MKPGGGLRSQRGEDARQGLHHPRRSTIAARTQPMLGGQARAAPLARDCPSEPTVGSARFPLAFLWSGTTHPLRLQHCTGPRRNERITDEGYIAVAGIAVALAVVGGVVWRWIEIARDKAPSPWDAVRRMPPSD
jgi:hypothetical protein